MMIFIPPLGTKLRLTADWSFPLHMEWRNTDAWRMMVEPDLQGYHYTTPDRKPEVVTLPEGMVLNVERIYIRMGAGEFDSVTFRVVDGPLKHLVPKKAKGTATGKCRFWVKLGDINNSLACEILE